MPENTDVFQKQSYLNLETLRKSGAGVQTPVWFVEDGGFLYVRTMLESGKVKRLRRNPQVKVAPCDMRGVLKGQWQSALAVVLADPKVDTRIEHLLLRKYGLMKRLFDFRIGAKPVMATIQISLEAEQVHPQS